MHYPEEKLKMAIAICQIQNRILLWIAKDLLQYSQKKDTNRFIIRKMYSTFQNMLTVGSPYSRYTHTLCIRYIDITSKENTIDVSIEIIINPE